MAEFAVGVTRETPVPGDFRAVIGDNTVYLPAALVQPLRMQGRHNAHVQSCPTCKASPARPRTCSAGPWPTCKALCGAGGAAHRRGAQLGALCREPCGANIRRPQPRAAAQEHPRPKLRHRADPGVRDPLRHNPRMFPMTFRLTLSVSGVSLRPAQVRPHAALGLFLFNQVGPRRRAGKPCGPLDRRSDAGLGASQRLPPPSWGVTQ